MNKEINKRLSGINFITATSVFAYAVLYSSFSLYFTEVLRFSKQQSNCIVGIFISFNFLLHLFAGYIGGRLVSHKCLLGIALVSQCIGSIFLAFFVKCYLYIGLCFFLIGCGFSVTCLNCLLTEQFAKEHLPEREKAFFVNYSALNFGFFLGFLASGYFYSTGNYNMLFCLNMVFSAASLLFFLIFQKHLVSEIRDSSQRFSIRSLTTMLLIGILFFAMLAGFYYKNVTNRLVLVVGLLSVMYILGQAKQNDTAKKIAVFMILMVSAVLFWTFYFIGPIGFVFFLKNNVCHTVFGHKISPQWFMNLESCLVIIGSPALAYFFQYLENHAISISIVKKFAFALLMVACAFFTLVAGIRHANALGFVSLGWIVLYYVFFVLGELLIAPVGYAIVGKLAPPHLQSIMMGTWLMICGLASVISHYISNSMDILSTNNPLVTNSNYLLVFCKIGIYAICPAGCLLLLSKKIDSLLENEKPRLNILNVNAR